MELEVEVEVGLELEVELEVELEECGVELEVEELEWRSVELGGRRGRGVVEERRRTDLKLKSNNPNRTGGEKPYLERRAGRLF